jgi:hypothetical protein
VDNNKTVEIHVAVWPDDPIKAYLEKLKELAERIDGIHGGPPSPLLALKDELNEARDLYNLLYGSD